MSEDKSVEMNAVANFLAVQNDFPLTLNSNLIMVLQEESKLIQFILYKYFGIFWSGPSEVVERLKLPSLEPPHYSVAKRMQSQRIALCRHSLGMCVCVKPQAV